MSFFKKLVRSRSNSYVDDDYEPQSPQDARAYDPNRPPSSWRHDSQPPDQMNPRLSSADSRDGAADQNMYAQQPQSMQKQMPYRDSVRSSVGPGGVMTNRSSRDGFVDVQSMGPPSMGSQGMGSPGMGSQGMGSPGMGSQGMGQQGMSSQGMSSQGMGQQGMGQQGMSSQGMGPQGMSSQGMGQQSMSSQGMGSQGLGQQMQPSMSSPKNEISTAPDMLTRAFHEAVRPYAEKIEGLEEQIRDLQTFVDQLEQQRLDVFAWIDKRGLRPDVPPTIAKQMDSGGPAAADALNGQLDRKITIVNFDLHRLQDDLNDSISSAHFAAAMAKFVPDVQRLASLPTGPKYAYDLIIKLVGNLNSHGGVEATRDMAGNDDFEDDRHARQDFYERMDDELIDVVRKRNQEGENWDIQKEIRRFERNAAFLKNLGIETYFPHALEAMKQEASSGGHATGGAGPSVGGGASYGGQGQQRPSPPSYVLPQK